MRRWTRTLGILAVCTFAAGQTPIPESGHAESAAIKDTVLQFREASVRGDVDGAIAFLGTSDPAFKQTIEPMARMFIAIEAVKSAADRVYGAGAGRAAQAGLAVPEEIDAANVVVVGDRAELTFDPSIGGPPEPLKLIRMGDRWKLDARAFATEDDEDGSRAATMAVVMAWGLEDSIDEIEQRKLQGGGNPVEFGMSRAMGLFTAPSTAEPEKLFEQLRTWQAERAVERKRRAQAAATQAAEPKAPVPPPILRPADQRDTPLEAAREFASAIARGDTALVAAMIEGETSAERALAEAEAQRFIAQSQLRRALIARSGKKDGMKFPMNDAGVEFAERYHVRGNGGPVVTVWWNDDFPTEENPDGTPRELNFARHGDVWVYATVSNVRAGNERPTAAELYDDAAGMREYARSLKATINDIESGKIKSIDELRPNR